MDETTRATEPLDPPDTPAQDADDPGPEEFVTEDFVPEDRGPEGLVPEGLVPEDRFPEDLGAGPERGRSPGRERDQLLNGPALFPGDAGQLPLPLRQVLVRLLRGPYVDGSNADAGTGARAWRTIVEHRRALDIRLNELFLRLVIDEDRKIALLQPVEMAEPFTTALQRQRELSREETLLLLRMRLILDRQQGTGKESTIQRSEVLEIFAQYLQGASQDAKGVEELADQTIRRLVNDRRLLVATELPEVFVISNALPLALPFEQIGDIRNLLESIAHSPEPADGTESDAEYDDGDRGGDSGDDSGDGGSGSPAPDGFTGSDGSPAPDGFAGSDGSPAPDGFTYSDGADGVSSFSGFSDSGRFTTDNSGSEDKGNHL